MKESEYVGLCSSEDEDAPESVSLQTSKEQSLARQKLAKDARQVVEDRERSRRRAMDTQLKEQASRRKIVEEALRQLNPDAFLSPEELAEKKGQILLKPTETIHHESSDEGEGEEEEAVIQGGAAKVVVLRNTRVGRINKAVTKELARKKAELRKIKDMRYRVSGPKVLLARRKIYANK